MSAPSRYSKEAEEMKYGFLAVKSKDAISKMLEKKELTGDELKVLSRARDFLLTIADGAQLVTEGVYHGHNSQESMAALNYAMDPLKYLQAALKDEQICNYFRVLADALHEPEISDARLTDEKYKHLEDASNFFEALYSNLLSAVSENRRSANRTPFSNYRTD